MENLQQQLSDIDASISNLGQKLEYLRTERIFNGEYSSIQLNELANALCLAQSEFPEIGKNRKGHNYKYADIDAIMNELRPILTKNSLCVIQQERVLQDSSTILHTILMHKSGQWIESRKKVIVLKSPNEHQAYGSALTYYRRYSLMSLLGITISNDTIDDDGDYRKPTYTTPAPTPAPTNTPKQPEVFINSTQASNIIYELDGYPEIHDRILEILKIEKIGEIPAKYYEATVKQIRNIKESMNSK